MLSPFSVPYILSLCTVTDENLGADVTVLTVPSSSTANVLDGEHMSRTSLPP